jgi:hypothetical protein
MCGDRLILTRDQESKLFLLRFCFHVFPTKLKFSFVGDRLFFGLYKTDFIFVIVLSPYKGRVFDENKTRLQFCFCFVHCKERPKMVTFQYLSRVGNRPVFQFCSSRYQ